MQQFKIRLPVSEVLTDGFAYRPGLVSLVGLGKRAQRQAERTNQQTGELENRVVGAEKTLKKPIDANSYTRAIDNLRKSILSLNVPAAQHPALNWLPRSED